MARDASSVVNPEVREAQARLDRAQPAAAVRRLLRAESQAVLSTHSARRRGWPFASLAPYALSRDGEPILLLARMAQHTLNLEGDPRSCLFVQDGRAVDPLAGARASLLGRVRRADAREVADVRARYLARHPQAEAYFRQHEFDLYLHGIDEVRFIGGFGTIGWVAGAEVVEDHATDALAPDAAAILAHLNEDHAGAIARLWRARGASADGVRAVGVDAYGLDLESASGRLRLDFGAPAASPGDVRDRVAALLRDAHGSAVA
jgi:heme oxygenase (biliverdin-IX-beta and delta-forming)